LTELGAERLRNILDGAVEALFTGGGDHYGGGLHYSGDTAEQSNTAFGAVARSGFEISKTAWAGHRSS
jgi:hypothetical protein